jgi:hypothetical protein
MISAIVDTCYTLDRRWPHFCRLHRYYSDDRHGNGNDKWEWMSLTTSLLRIGENCFIASRVLCCRRVSFVVWRNLFFQPALGVCSNVLLRKTIIYCIKGLRLSKGIFCCQSELVFSAGARRTNALFGLHFSSSSLASYSAVSCYTSSTEGSLVAWYRC